MTDLTIHQRPDGTYASSRAEPVKAKRVDRDFNKGRFTDGELLPCIGGPIDGQTRSVGVLFPFINGGVPSAGLTIKSGGAVHQYLLDHDRRAWVFVKTEAA